VVKFQNNPRHTRILVNEMQGTRLAARLGLPTPPVAVVEGSPDLIRQTPELCVELPRARLPCTPGLQFASRYPGDPHRGKRPETVADPAYEAVMIDQGFCVNAGEWTFPDAPLRGLYARNRVYLGVTGHESFEPWIERIEKRMTERVLDRLIREVPPEWYADDLDSVIGLGEQLLRRRKLVPDLISAAKNTTRRLFPNWA
jgi:hypothetical protein